MNSAQLADALIDRLNELIGDKDVRADVEELMDHGVLASPSTREHLSLQVSAESDPKRPMLRFLGLLNGIVSDDETALITAVYDQEGAQLMRFERTNKLQRKTS